MAATTAVILLEFLVLMVVGDIDLFEHRNIE